ncbi:hypothetical protein DMN77_03960 [Paenibacillus sp. 79R4]|nr:hypothetical protein [Paenibacillus sp. 79R4]
MAKLPKQRPTDNELRQQVGAMGSGRVPRHGGLEQSYPSNDPQTTSLGNRWRIRVQAVYPGTGS